MAKYDPLELTNTYNLSEIERKSLDEKLLKQLKERQLLSQDKLEEALEHQNLTKLSLWRTLLNLDFLSTTDMDNLLKPEAPSLKKALAQKNLGVFLVENGFLDKKNLREAKKTQKSKNMPLELILLAKEYITEENLAKALAQMHDLPFVDLEKQKIDKELLSNWPQEVLCTNVILPLSKREDRLVLAFSNPQLIDTFLENHMRFLIGISIDPCIASSTQILKILEEQFGKKHTLTSQSFSPEEFIKHRAMVFRAFVEKAGTAKLTDLIVREGFTLSASDIHLEDMKDHTRVRFRIDGQLQEIISLEKKIGQAVMTRIKVASNLDITAKKSPQDGHGLLEFEGARLEFRVSSVPTCLGEKLVLRLFHKKNLISSFVQMGLEAEQEELLSYFSSCSHGMFLTSGPVGSGKTTTLYTILNNIDILRKNVMTIEDPVEYYLQGINQLQVSKNMSFSNGVRALLRQDPDVIMVGEIRDETTAQIAVRASLTGILVLSTLHTTDAASAVIALKNLGIKDFLIASALLGVVNQRLIRKICPECKDVSPADAMLWEKLKLPKLDTPLYRGKGCPNCMGTGYRKMTGVYEFLFMDDEIKSLTMTNAAVKEIKEAAQKSGMKNLQKCAFKKAIEGVTTVEEIMRTVLF